jgi:hypothetical protein
VAKKATNKPANQVKRGPNWPYKPAQFKPGQSGNPAGRPAAGATIREWWNQMQGWTLLEVEAVLLDDIAPVSKKAAARAFIDACSEEKTAAGQPIAGGDLDRIIEHTAGKAVQPIDSRGEMKLILDPAAAMKKLMGDEQAFEAATQLADRLKAIESHGGAEPSRN